MTIILTIALALFVSAPSYEHDVARFTNVVSLEEPAPEPVAVWSVDWDALAYCESTNRWDYNGGSGFDGGLQFHPKTWTWLKPDGFPEFAWQATKEQQIEVAEITLGIQGLKAWPACTKKLGWR